MRCSPSIASALFVLFPYACKVLVKIKTKNKFFLRKIHSSLVHALPLFVNSRAIAVSFEYERILRMEGIRTICGGRPSSGKLQMP